MTIGLPSPKDLEAMHLVDGMSIADLSKVFGCTNRTIRRHLNKAVTRIVRAVPDFPESIAACDDPLPVTMPEFMALGICATTDPALFFPENGDGKSSRVARAICAQCPVTAECLDWAVTHHEMGVWGGTTEAGRRKIRHQSDRSA
jgi:WhiB family redox-sensing transcriptional regulator